MDDEAGSVLIEAVVATAIAAMVLIAAWRVVGDSATRHHALASRREALMVARSQLAAAGVAAPLTQGVTEGRDTTGALWRLQATPCGSTRSAAGVLYCIKVAVRARPDGPALVTLATRRLAPAA